jgi:hypothetical protein
MTGLVEMATPIPFIYMRLAHGRHVPPSPLRRAWRFALLYKAGQAGMTRRD